jgi:hypothetical protein
LTLPAIVDRNFSFPNDLRHNVWIEGGQAFVTSIEGLSPHRFEPHLYRLAGSIDDSELARARPSIITERNPYAGRLAARIGDGEIVVQEIKRSVESFSAFMLVIDGSARIAGLIPELVRALDAIPAGSRAGAILATDPLRVLPTAPWSAEQKDVLIKLLRSTAFVGGQDNTPALAEALRRLEAEQRAELLWIHGPQPVRFEGSAASLEQVTARLSRFPDVTLYAVEPGANELLPDAPWVWRAHSLPRTTAMATDLSDFFARVSGRSEALAIIRTQSQSANGISKGSDHIARLWANERVLDLMQRNLLGNRGAAVAFATRYQLVTPVTGAVVLETKQQYDESQLTPVSQGTVPTIPEPHEWALALIALAGSGWLFWSSRRRVARTA